MTYVPEYTETSYKLIQNNQNGEHQLVKEMDRQFTGDTIQRLKKIISKVSTRVQRKTQESAGRNNNKRPITFKSNNVKKTETFLVLLLVRRC